jgi:hypothetical protein
LVSLSILAALFLAGGCMTFEHDWAKAAKLSVPPNTLLGRWGGTWQSEANGHNGSLRCVVTQDKDGGYRARFHAIYAKVIGFGYTVPLRVTETNGVFEFNGRANLGWWAGGVYQYAGRAEGTNFSSTYHCKYDHGTFHMTKRL